MPQGPMKRLDVATPKIGTTGRGNRLHAANRIYVDSTGGGGGGSPVPPGTIAPLLETRYVNVAGDTMEPTKTIALGRDPTADMEAATKLYVDSKAGTPFPEAPVDGTPYSRQDAGWVPASTALALDAGLGLTIDATTTPNPTISLNPATDALIGGVTEPPPDAKGYVRTTQLDGTSQWVPPAGPASIHYGLGLSHDEATSTVNLQPAGFGDPKFLGGIYEPPMDGVAHSRQFDALTQTWVWVPALTAGLQITSIIPDKAIYGPAEPPLTVHAYGSEFTATCVIHVDDSPAQTAFVSATELTFVINPAVPINEQFHIITVHETAPTPAAGLGAEQFDFIKASTEVDYGTGLTLDTAPTPPIVNLQPATDFSIGGLMEPPQEAGKQWAREFDPTLAEGWKWAETKGMDEPPAEPAQTWGRSSAGARGWLPIPESTPVTAGIGLSETNGEFKLDIAGNSTLGGVMIPGAQGLDISQTGNLTLARATPETLGGLVDAPRDDTGQKQFARKWGEWVEVEPGGMEEPPASPVALWGRTSSGDRGWAEIPTFDHLTGFVEKIGDTMQGFLTLHDDPVEPFHAATRNWVELELQLKVDEPPNDDVAYARKWKEWVKVEEAQGMAEPPAEPVAIWGRSSSGDRGWLEVPTFDHLTGFVSKLGDTMTGPLTLDGPPTLPLHAASKDYVDLSEPQEAPHNGKAYARQDGQWVEVEAATGGGIGDVPNDPVQPWSRTPGRWVEAVAKETVDAKVDKIGDTMSGPLTLSGPPTEPLHAASKDYVDLSEPQEAPHDGKSYARKDGQWVEVETVEPGSIPIASHTVLGAVIVEEGLEVTPVGGLSLMRATPEDIGGIQDAPRDDTGLKAYSRRWGEWVEAENVNDKVNTFGDTMTGPLVLSGPPTYPLHAVTKDYVDLHDIGEAPTDGMAYARINASWDALPAALQDVPKALDAKVDRLGDTMTGPLVLHGPPTQPLHATTMDWVDLNYLKDAPNDDQTYGRKGGLWKPTVGFEEAPIDGNLWGRQDGEWESVSHQLRNKVDKAGDTMSGHLNLPGFPEYGTHAASKAYVDSRTAGVIIATEPPADAEPGALWWESDSADLFIRYDDGSSVQWVQATDPGIPEAPKDGLGYWRRDEAWEAASLFLDRKVNTSGDWMSGPLGLPAGDPTDPHHATSKAYVDRHVTGAKILTGDDPPANPEENQLWWESDTGCLFIWYTDQDSSQWVQVVGGDASSVQEAPIDGTPYMRQDGAWIPNTVMLAAASETTALMERLDSLQACCDESKARIAQLETALKAKR